VILSGANTYSGATNVNAGTLQAGIASVANVSGAFGLNSAVTTADVSGSGINLAGFNTQIGSLAGGGNAGGDVALGSANLTTGGDGSSTSFGGRISGTGGLTKTGSGTFTLSAENTYTGGTVVESGVLVVNGSLANTTLILDDGATLTGSGSIAGLTTFASGAVHSPSNGIGTQTFAGLNYQSGAVFEWNLEVSFSDMLATDQSGLRGVSFDGVNADSVTGGGGILKIILGSGVDYSNEFFTRDRNWSGIFSTSSPTNLASLFSEIEVWSAGLRLDEPTYGGFYLDGADLKLTSNTDYGAIPEPSSALFGLLIAAGLMRRRRPAA